MNDRTHEGNEFSRWTWTPRTSQSAAERAYAGVRPCERSAKWADRVILAMVVGFVAAMLWGAL